LNNSYFHIKEPRRSEIMSIFREFNVHYVFSGHLHQNSVAHSTIYNLTNITTSAVGMQLGQSESGFRIVKVYQKEIEHFYCGFSEVPKSIQMSDKLREDRM